MIWMPYANIKANLDVLKDEHVMDVVFQGMQCLRNIYNEVEWRDVLMWRNHPQGLLFYVVAAEQEMRERGHAGEPRVHKAFTWVAREEDTLAPRMPWWFGYPLFHTAQRSHLIAIDPVYYTRRMPFTTPLEIPLMWPKERQMQ